MCKLSSMMKLFGFLRKLDMLTDLFILDAPTGIYSDAAWLCRVILCELYSRFPSIIPLRLSKVSPIESFRLVGLLSWSVTSYIIDALAFWFVDYWRTMLRLILSRSIVICDVFLREMLCTESLSLSPSSRRRRDLLIGKIVVGGGGGAIVILT